MSNMLQLLPDLPVSHHQSTSADILVQRVDGKGDAPQSDEHLRDELTARSRRPLRPDQNCQ